MSQQWENDPTSKPRSYILRIPLCWFATNEIEQTEKLFERCRIQPTSEENRF